VFAGHPDVYSPRFASYDRSLSNPLSGSWSAKGSHFFHSEQTRAAFLANPGRIIDIAERKWADIVRGLGS
jgi:hypothetical protein